jgi:hypothetical protein
VYRRVGGEVEPSTVNVTAIGWVRDTPDYIHESMLKVYRVIFT